MKDNLIEELKSLAEKILNEEALNDLESSLELSRALHEKFLILNHLHLNNAAEDSFQSGQGEVEKSAEDEALVLTEESKLATQESIEADPPVLEEELNQVENDKTEEEEPLTLSDLFVPTFEEIKDDFSQKSEFKDTISLDETENMFQVKKEASKQLSLNDKLLGNSIQVGLNDRIAFVNKLFNFSQSDFNKVLARLNDCDSKEEAFNYFQYQVKPNYNWKGKEELEDRFKGLIERKFL
ncbi:hypothetical protein LCM02_10620 [Lutimonas saemankumensis]|uniref:hypothetical protein n=1 Tax=Lutimonas saemankumensis TaxID=483016 RepID=UPI001CD417C7|nr:hypothetical protein [Lutimonas saemankumensis]MCA0932904.1 hypothetical protein [Lutimonas saemankumensis]